MQITLDSVRNDAASLSPSDRAALADWLFDSVSPLEDVEHAWSEEVARRLERLATGVSSVSSIESALDRIRRRLAA